MFAVPGIQEPLLQQFLTVNLPALELSQNTHRSGTVLLEAELQPYLVRLGIPNWKAPTAQVARRVLDLLRSLEQGQVTTDKLKILLQPAYLDDTIFYPLATATLKFFLQAPAFHINDTLNLLVARAGLDPNLKQQVVEALPKEREYTVATELLDPLLYSFKISKLSTHNSALVTFIAASPYAAKLYELEVTHANLDETFPWPHTFDRLEIIDLSHNNYRDYPFKGLKALKLQSLNLNYNRIQVVTRKWQRLRVRKLSLSHNQLQEFPVQLLGCMEYGVVLNLDFNPLLTSHFPRYTLREVPGLRVNFRSSCQLSLRFCELTQLPTILQEVLDTAEYPLYDLNLEGNKLRAFTLSIKSKNIFILNVSYNRLVRLDLSKLNVKALTVYASHNRLQWLSAIPSTTREIDASYNPLSYFQHPVTQQPLKLNAKHTLLP